MKIIIVGPAWPLRGGIASFNEELALSFQNAGHEVKIISYSLQYPSFLFPGKSQEDRSRQAPETLEIFPMINSINPFTWFKTSRFIKKENPDLIILRYWIPFMSPALSTISAFCRRIKNSKIIGFADNILPHEKRPGDKLLTSIFVKACDGFMVMSRSVEHDLRTFDHKKPIKNNPHPIYSHYGDKMDKSEARNFLDLPTEGKYLLFFGFIRKYKGLQVLLQAMSAPELKNLGIKLIVAGEFYEDKQTYLDLIKKEDLSDHVILMDEFIPDDKVKYLFCAADLITQPYLTATQSGVTQIAYHFEKPMLVTDVGGLPEIVPDGKAGYVCKPEADSIKDAILDFYNNNKEAQLIQGVREEKPRFSWGKMVSSFIELRNELDDPENKND